MTKRNLITAVFIFCWFLPLTAQVNSEGQALKREVTLYNPYKPSLGQSRKISLFPVMNDTSKVRPVFQYKVSSEPFMPSYTISPIKAASLLPEPLQKLYKSYVNIGFGSYISPLAEISITNERSKKGNIGLYARHYSTNGKMELENMKKVYAGYMDNDVSLFGRKFFRKSLLEGSVDLAQKNRYAYGYDPVFLTYDPLKNDIKYGYDNVGAKASLSSLNLDSSSVSFKFSLAYNYLTMKGNLFQHKVGFDGEVAKNLNEFYAGAGLSLNTYSMPADISPNSKFIASVSPYIKKNTDQWYFKLGMTTLVERNMTSSPVMHFYPDVNMGFNIVPSYMMFFAGLSGYLETNEPTTVFRENPFLISKSNLFTTPNTDHQLIVTAGLKGNSGTEGSYLLSATYSTVKNMLFYTNIVNDTLVVPQFGNFFTPVTDDIDIMNIHGEINGKINEKLSFYLAANMYQYTLTIFEHAWDKPNWDGNLGVKYNLRNKIIAGIDISGQGVRYELINGYISPASQSLSDPIVPGTREIVSLPMHFNLNFSAEYRYSKILSFWTKLNNISNTRYYEWSYYPTHRFLFMLGFTYSL